MPIDKNSFDHNNPKDLEQHISDTLEFYDLTGFDAGGGFFHHFRNDGSIYDRETRHLVSSTRFIFNYAMAARYFNRSDYVPYVEHGLEFLQTRHLVYSTGGYAWQVRCLPDETEVVDRTNHCYGLAFVMVAGATAMLAGVESAGRDALENAYNLMEEVFWDDAHGLYKDEANADFTVIDGYRGQNANMHACEAMLWAYEATGETRYLDKAEILAQNITRRQTANTSGMIWEHYNQHWEIDWEYNKNDPKNLFRPWGFQPGHQTEWAKLLLILNRHRPQDWHIPTAKHLFDNALNLAWDKAYGGICYGFNPQGEVCDTDKYFWVQAESIAAASLLAKATGESQYSDWYNKIWQYSWQNMVDHEYGAWYRILTQANQQYDDLKSPAGKTDYHTMGACYEVLRHGHLAA